MPLQATSGAASQDAFGGNGVAVVPNYIEDVFSTYLYTGNGTSQTITNGVDLSTKGGFVWLKYRSGSAGSSYHHVYDSARGKSSNASYNYLYPNVSDPQGTGAFGPTSFNTTGFTLNDYLNESSIPYVSWTWAKQPKFFDIQRWTGSGANRTISHALGSVPACIMVKRTDTTGDWQVYHRSLANTEYLVLNSTAAKATGATRWNSTTPTSSVFSLGTDATVNASAGTYVAYIFAHDAGGFGLSGSDNVISCGSATMDGSGGATVNLGYEPQWVMIKRTDSTGSWFIEDTMRGLSVGSQTSLLAANTSGAEINDGNIYNTPTSTGFTFTAGLFAAGATYIYIAIRRGPMKVPTLGTSVFAVADSAASFPLTLNSNFKVDAILAQQKTTNVGLLAAALTQRAMPTYQQFNESDFGGVGSAWTWDKQTGLIVTDWGGAGNVVSYCLGRAPNFMDVVCYTGTGSNTTQAHNLGVVPELIIVKCRSVGNAWAIYSSALGNTKYLVLNTTAAAATGATWWNSTTPTSSVFSIGTTGQVNTSSATYVAYLFATCAGVSKVGSYTGTGTTLQIDCGFTAGARFIYIKRTDATGGWHVWDSARGIISGNDPYFLTNSTNAQVTGTDYIDPYSAGFEISSTAPAEINASAGTYIFLAIA